MTTFAEAANRPFPEIGVRSRAFGNLVPQVVYCASVVRAGREIDGIRVADDDELAAALTAASAGDETGFATVWRALQPALLRYLRVIVGDAAEDVASETWLQASRDLHRFDGGPAAFRGWLFRIARNRAIDERRRTGRRPEEPATTEQDAGPPAPDAAGQALESSGTAWALAIIASLPRDQAEAVMLRAVAGLSVADAAHVLGKRPGAVRIATMRGLRRLAADPRVRARGGDEWLPGGVGEARPEGV
jgi:RNA polymerase sigma-70 factor (ECF subfamily)